MVQLKHGFGRVFNLQAIKFWTLLFNPTISRMAKKPLKNIPNLLRKHRKLVGYKQSEVAEILDLKSANRISRWEKGQSAPGLLNLLKLSIIYSTLCDQLYEELVRDMRKEIVNKKETVLRKRKKKN